MTVLCVYGKFTLGSLKIKQIAVGSGDMCPVGYTQRIHLFMNCPFVLFAVHKGKVKGRTGRIFLKSPQTVVTSFLAQPPRLICLRN